jgi:hypothetical protein
MKKRLVLGLLAGSAAAMVAVATVRADPDLTNVPAHRHWVRTAMGSLVEVGPRVCDNPNLQKAFNQFHNNIHVATGSSIGTAAPGLHNFSGGEIRFSAC